MAGPKAPVTVTVDADVAKRADEAYEQEIEAEVQKRIDQETHHKMDAAEKAALDAAQKQAVDAHKRADALETKLKEAETRADQDRKVLADKFDALAKTLQARADAERAVADSALAEKATLIAEARGFKGDAVATEAKRIASLGDAAVTELLKATPAPAGDALLLQLRGGAPAKDSHIVAGADAIEGFPTLTVANWDSGLKSAGVHPGGRVSRKAVTA